MPLYSSSTPTCMSLCFDALSMAGARGEPLHDSGHIPATVQDELVELALIKR